MSDQALLNAHQPRIYVVDDNPHQLKSLAFLLDAQEAEVLTYPNPSEFLVDYRKDIPACLVLDVHLPGMSGLDLQDRLREMKVDLPLIFISGQDDCATAVKAMREGAFDFFVKPLAEAELLARINAALALDRKRRQTFIEMNTLAARFALLTEKESQILHHIVAGDTNKVASDRLGISPKTVEAHRARIMTKLRVGSLAELVVANYRINTCFQQKCCACTHTVD